MGELLCSKLCQHNVQRPNGGQFGAVVKVFGSQSLVGGSNPGLSLAVLTFASANTYYVKQDLALCWGGHDH